MQKNLLMPKLLKCARDPTQRQGERELARSEGCLAGATERLFVGLPARKNNAPRIIIDFYIAYMLVYFGYGEE